MITARPRKPVAKSNLVRTKPDHGTKERWQHAPRSLEVTAEAGVVAARNLAEQPLDRLVLAGLLDDKAREAGVRLRADYHGAHLENRIIASYNVVRSCGGGYSEYERTDAEEAAYCRWRAAVQAVGIIDSKLVVAICCHDQMPRAAQIEPLKRGLARLQSWYKL